MTFIKVIIYFTLLKSLADECHIWTLNSVFGINPNCLYHVVNTTFWKQLQDVTAVLNARLKAPTISSKALQKSFKIHIEKTNTFCFSTTFYCSSGFIHFWRLPLTYYTQWVKTLNDMLFDQKSILHTVLCLAHCGPSPVHWDVMNGLNDNVTTSGCEIMSKKKTTLTSTFIFSLFQTYLKALSTQTIFELL